MLTIKYAYSGFVAIWQQSWSEENFEQTLLSAKGHTGRKQAFPRAPRVFMKITKKRKEKG